MKPVFQTIVDKGRGDCMRAAIASLFELEIEQVPHFILFGDDWFKVFINYLKGLGWTYEGTRSPKSEMPIFEDDEGVNGYFYAVVKSKTFEGVTHAVIIDKEGIVVHDPNPNNAWLGINIRNEMEYWFLLEKRTDPYL